MDLRCNSRKSTPIFMLNKRLKKSERGISLVECIIAIVIITIGITSLLQSFYTATASAINSEFVVIANNVANQQMENILQDKAQDGYDAILTASYPLTTQTVSNMEFTTTTNIYEVSGADFVSASVGSGLKRVDVTTSWNGNQSNVSYGMIVADY